MSDKRIHLEEYLYLPALTHNGAIIAWGGFYFEVKGDLDTGKWNLLKDHEAPAPDPARPGTIGLSAKPYGPQAKVLVWEEGQPDEGPAQIVVNQNYAHVRNLKPDTVYRYRVLVQDDAGQEREWAAGALRDWGFNGADDKGGLRVQAPPRRYDNVFRTFPAPSEQVTELNFAVLGDFGRGVRKPSAQPKCQREIAAALEWAVNTRDVRLILTTGDNVYRGGDDDQEWFFTYFQPYRYLLNRVPVFPTFGNHDDGESELNDDRAQLYDNLYVLPHFTRLRPSQEASIEPGLFYRVPFGAQIEFICLDTSKQSLFNQRYFNLAEHREFIEQAFALPAPTWRIPFCHHPAYSAGPRHKGKSEVRELLEGRGQAGGVRVVFSGHEHNLQHARHAGLDYFVTGGGGEFRTDAPDSSSLANEKIVSWGGNDEGHFLLVEITGAQMTVTPVGKLAPPPEAGLRQIKLNLVPGQHDAAPFVIAR